MTDNEDRVRQMIAGQKDMKIPSELIPRCPVCGAPMTMNLLDLRIPEKDLLEFLPPKAYNMVS